MKHPIGWCVPTAVAALTGWTRERVWLDILAQRHERGRRLTNLPGRIDAPVGGAHAAEAIRTLDRAGWEVVSAWAGTRRMSVAEFRAFVDRDETTEWGTQNWLVLQRMHLAHLLRFPWDDDTLIDGLPVAKAWRVVPKYPATDPGDAELDLLAGTMAVAEMYRPDE